MPPKISGSNKSAGEWRAVPVQKSASDVSPTDVARRKAAQKLAQDRARDSFESQPRGPL